MHLCMSGNALMSLRLSETNYSGILLLSYSNNVQQCCVTIDSEHAKSDVLDKTLKLQIRSYHFLFLISCLFSVPVFFQLLYLSTPFFQFPLALIPKSNVSNKVIILTFRFLQFKPKVNLFCLVRYLPP